LVSMLSHDCQREREVVAMTENKGRAR